MKFFSKKAVLLATLMMGFGAPQAYARDFCAMNVRIIKVVQGDTSFGSVTDIGIVVQDTSGNTKSFTTWNYGNVKDGADIRSLMSMALAAMSSQMPVDVIAESCSDTSGGWYRKWSGLKINAR